MISEVVYFNRQILGVVRPTPKLLEKPEALWLTGALDEEVSEFAVAHERDGDLVESVDALIDLIYFAIGGLYRLGLDEAKIEKCFAAVHQANLQKKLGVKASRPQDGTVADAIKLPDFKSPSEAISKILQGD